MTLSVEAFVAHQQQLNKRRRILHPMLRRLLKIVANIDVEGLDNVPQSGPTLIMSNHISRVDPVVFTGLLPRYMVSMAKIETLNSFSERTLLKLWGNFVIKRGEVDRDALKKSIELLKSENPLWIAPEGTRNPDGLGEARGGVAYIAHKANAVIVPSAIVGVKDWAHRLRRFKKSYAKVIFGRPFKFYVPEGERFSRDVREQMIREAMYQLALAMPDEYANQRGVYSDIEHATTHYIKFLDE